MDDLIGNMYAVWRIRKRFHINGLLTEPHGDLIKCMISRRDPLEFWSQALGGHLTNSSLEYWCRSPLLSSQPCFITKSASWKPDSSLMHCQPVCGPASLRWLMNIGSDCGSQRGGRGDAPQRPTDLAQSLGGDTSNSVTSSDSAPQLPRLCLFYSLSFVSDSGFLKPCLCSGGFLDVYALESRLQRFLVKSTFFNIV